MSFLLKRIQIFLERELFFCSIERDEFFFSRVFFSSFDIVCFLFCFSAKENCVLSSAMRKLSFFFFLEGVEVSLWSKFGFWSFDKSWFFLPLSGLSFFS